MSVAERENSSTLTSHRQVRLVKVIWYNCQLTTYNTHTDQWTSNISWVNKHTSHHFDCTATHHQTHDKQMKIHKKTLTLNTTSSSAMAERPCDCGVLCLHPKSSLCSCRQLLYVRPALHRTCLCREVGTFRRWRITFAEYFTGKEASPTNHCWC